MTMKKIFFVVIFFSISFLLFAQSRTNVGIEKAEGPAYIFRQADPHSKEIALTFDDGPNDPYTTEILDILKKYNAKATFFVVGKNVLKYPQTVKRMYLEGHAIGNHTYGHPDLIVKGGLFKMRKEMIETEEIIQDVTGQKPFLFRPPYGSGGNIEAKNRGYYIIEWSVSAKNGAKDPDPDTIIKNVLLNTRGGSVILCHDGLRLKNFDRSNMVKALPAIILYLQSEGYKFVTVPELFNLNPPTPEKNFKVNGLRRGKPRLK